MGDADSNPDQLSAARGPRRLISALGLRPNLLATERAATLLAVAAVVVPFVVVVTEVAGRSWVPAGDVALEMLQIGEVGSARTPTTGAWSRWGWNHPGPLLFYVLAPFTWVFGNVGALIGVAVVNAAAATASVLIARRRGGLRLAALVGLVVVLLSTTLGPALWINPWNPWVGLLPMYCYMLLAWSIAERDIALLPYLIGVGTFIIQAHAGFSPVVVAVGLVAAAMAWRPRRRLVSEQVSTAPGLGRSVVIAVAVGVVLWLPPMIGELTREPGNLGLLFDFVRDPPQPAAGWQVAWRIMATEIGLPGAWITGTELNPFELDPSWLPAVMLLTVVAVLGSIATWRGHSAPGRLAAMSIISTLASFVATSRVLGPPYDYMMRWWWIIGATLWLSIGWSTLSMITSSRFRPWINRAMIAVTAVLSLLVAGQATSVELPDHQRAQAVEALGPQLTERLDPDTRYLVVWADSRTWGAVGVGVFVSLHEQGFDVSVPLEQHMYVFDSWHRQKTSTAHHVIHVIGYDDLAAGVQAPPGAVRIARHDPLSPGERRQADRLWATAQSELHPSSDLGLGAFDSGRGRRLLIDAGVDPQAVKQLAAYRGEGPAYNVYLVEN